jgi:hypothetical protein
MPFLIRPSRCFPVALVVIYKRCKAIAWVGPLLPSPAHRLKTDGGSSNGTAVALLIRQANQTHLALVLFFAFLLQYASPVRLPCPS